MKPACNVQGKVAVITGAAKGLGFAMASRLAEHGAKVIIGDVDSDTGERVADSIGAGFVTTDVTRQEDVERLIDRAVGMHGHLDILVNNAGIGPAERVTDLTQKNIDQTIEVNLKGVLYGLKFGGRKIADGGSIVNVSSMAGWRGSVNYATYAATKAGVIAATRTAAIELGGRGVRVNAICPSQIQLTEDQEWWDDSDKLAAQVIPRLQPINRLATAGDVAALVHFLASDDSAILSGLSIPIDGASSAGLSLNVVEAVLGSLSE